MPGSQKKCAKEPETSPSVPQQEEQPDATEGKVIVDYDLDIDYYGSASKNEPVTQEEKEENSDAEYTNVEITQDRTFCQRILPCNVMQEIQQVHLEQGPKIVDLWLQDMYIWLGFSPIAAKLLVRESPERLRVLINKNVDDICNVVRKPSGKNTNGMWNRGQQVSVIAQENLKL